MSNTPAAPADRLICAVAGQRPQARHSGQPTPSPYTGQRRGPGEISPLWRVNSEETVKAVDSFLPATGSTRRFDVGCGCGATAASFSTPRASDDGAHDPLQFEIRCIQPAQVRQVVERLRQAALDLPMTEVSAVVEFSGVDCDFHTQDEHRWLLVQAGNMTRIGSLPPDRAQPRHRLFRLARRRVRDDESGIGDLPRHIRDRRGHATHWPQRLVMAFVCKTQFASNPGVGGIANFVRCHLAVIRLLDQAKALGILESVNDEGGYWENRDVKALVETVGQWNSMLAGLVGQFKDQFSGMVVAPITDFPNFEHLEAEGRKGERDDLGG